MLDKDEQRIFFSCEHPATSHCFGLSGRSLRAAEIQVERIWEHPGLSANHPQFMATAEDVLIDVHFYFIALRNLYRFLHKVAQDPVFAHLQPELHVLNDKWFKHYARGREAFEHIDQRLPGEKYESRVVQITENGASRKVCYGLNMRSGLFMHSDLTFDISRGTFQHLRQEVAEFLAQIVESCPPNPFEQAHPV